MAKWFLLQKKADFQKIGQDFGIDQVTARIIRNRNITENEAIGYYLKPTADILHDPLQMKGMAAGAAIIRDKILEEAPIRIIGDYDVDGVCSTYILLKGLRSLEARVDAVIPHRMTDGYGLNERLVQEASDRGIDTIITCDNGISAAAEVSKARELGLTVVVTDHHDVPEMIPEADCVIDPKQPGDTYPFKGICGAMVAFKFVEALYGEFADEGANFLDIQRELMECAALATVCDVMEVVDENRYVIKKGLEYLKNPCNLGLKALKEVMEIESDKISTFSLGFMLGPCINSAGRLSSAMEALELLLEEDYEAALEKAGLLKDLNDKRKNMTQKMVSEAIGCVETGVKSACGEEDASQNQSGFNAGDLDENSEVSPSEDRKSIAVLDKLLVVYLPECHLSLTGLVAGRLREMYSRPVFVFADSEGGITGSGRSVEEYHMYEGLTKCSGLFTKFGGHSQAAGLSMPRENLEEFIRRINEDCGLKEEDFVHKLKIDCAMPMSYQGIDRVAGEMALLEPFGAGNPEPVFAQKDLALVRASVYGKSKNVVRLTVRDEKNRHFDLIQFGNEEKFGLIADFLDEKYGSGAAKAVFGDSMQYLKTSGKGHGRIYQKEIPINISLAYTVGINSFQGRENTQLTLVDFC